MESTLHGENIFLSLKAKEIQLGGIVSTGNKMVIKN